LGWHEEAIEQSALLARVAGDALGLLARHPRRHFDG
jgi:hypothetical protein